MDIFKRFNRKHIDDRQIDTLIGLSKGLIADGKVDQAEAECLLAWLVQSRQASNNPMIENLLERVSAMLQDGELDPDESRELLTLLQRFTGEPSEVGELAKPSMLPVDEPMPEIVFPERSFLFTGTCVFGTRKDCQAAVEQLGGVNAKGVTKTLDYLVLGTYVTESWAHESYGRKIEKAMAYRDGGVPIVIVTERHWAECGQVS